MIVLLCLGATAAAFVFLCQVRAGPVSWLRSYAVQRSARSAACILPAQRVAGSYQVDPVQHVGDYLVVAVTAQCNQAGRPRQSVEGYSALDSTSGEGCSGTGSFTPVATPAGGSVLVEQVSSATCGDAQGAVSLVTGQVSGSAATAIEVQFANDAVAGGPIQNGRFVVVAPVYSAVCLVRVLDADGALLASHRNSTPPGPAQSLGACP
ncbi:MAG: hypothetical protein IT318_26440 [Anaerolineales bacterium]|nr:hypothetical protein [Anaerolineales bacterium]